MNRTELQEAVGKSQPALEISLLEPPYFEYHWPSIEKELDRVPHIWSDHWTKESIFDAVMCHRMQCWTTGPKTAFTLVVFSQVVTYPAQIILQVGPIFGTGLMEALDLLDATLDRFAQVNGCSLIRSIVRPGFEKLLKDRGVKKSFVVLTRPVMPQGVH